MKAVVFDYGGVISYVPDELIWREVAALGGIGEAELREASAEFRGEYDRGMFSCEDYYRMVLAAAGAPAEAFDPARLSRMAELDEQAWSQVNPETARLMEEVKRAGYTLGILSNMSKSFQIRICAAHEAVFSLADESVFSCDLGFIKPEKAIYEALLDRLPCEASETVFFDDLRENVEKARDLGIQAYVWSGPAAGRAVLRSLGAAV
jgi:putative hydrolase of the HAD superfamily